MENLPKNNKNTNIGTLTRDDFDGGPISLDEIEKGLYLGNLTAATNQDTLKTYKITHILTLDSVPLPSHITDLSLITKYIHISDLPKEDILYYFDESIDFINSCLEKKENILVHCYFGVSRSSTIVIAYVMKKYNISYDAAFERVRIKRKFVAPNDGFVFQLKLYRKMLYKIDTNYQKYKTYRLRMAADKVRKAKILPQNCMDLIRPDPDIIQENPEPIVYRCRKCRRALANKSYVLLHKSKANKMYDISNITDIEHQDGEQNLNNDNMELNACKNIIFLEPIAWMKDILCNTQGRLNCPKCTQKLGNFSWINGCHCPCGAEISPAFYLVPSKVDLSKAVQNVQMTV